MLIALLVGQYWPLISLIYLLGYFSNSYKLCATLQFHILYCNDGVVKLDFGRQVHF